MQRQLAARLEAPLKAGLEAPLKAFVEQPSKVTFLAARDAVLLEFPSLVAAGQIAELDRVLPNLKAKIILDGAGHWVQQERPDEVNAALIDFLKS